MSVASSTKLAADSGRAQDLLANLFRNAIEHNDGDVEIEIGYWSPTTASTSQTTAKVSKATPRTCPRWAIPRRRTEPGSAWLSSNRSLRPTAGSVTDRERQRRGAF